MSFYFAIVSKTRHQVVKQLERLDRYCNWVVVFCHFAIENTSAGGKTVRSFG